MVISEEFLIYVLILKNQCVDMNLFNFKVLFRRIGLMRYWSLGRFMRGSFKV